MLMSVIETEWGSAAFGELAGARVLVTGVGEASGVDVVRAFADHKARLIVHSADDGPQMTELCALLAQSAAELRHYAQPIADGDEAVRLAQNAAQDFGGLDAVVNLVVVTQDDLRCCRSQSEVEDLISTKLLPALMITRVAANRMSLTFAQGSILNVLVCPDAADSAGAALIGMLRTSLATITRKEAEAWAGKEIRINAVGPRSSVMPSAGAALSSEPDLAHLALYLASRKGRNLTGYTFDSE